MYPRLNRIKKVIERFQEDIVYGDFPSDGMQVQSEQSNLTGI